jgi:hypothetical protein
VSEKSRNVENLIGDLGNGYYFYWLDGKAGIYAPKPSKIQEQFEKSIGFLNENCEIVDNGSSVDYLEETRPVVDEVTKLKHNDNLQILEYESGKKCLYDALENIITREKIFETLEVFYDKVSPLKCKLVRTMFEFPVLFPWGMITKVRIKHILNYFSKNILGQYDANALPISQFEGTMRIVSANITRYVTEMYKDKPDVIPSKIGEMKKYVVMHEDIHDRQAFNFPEINLELNSVLKRLLLSMVIELYGGIKEVPEAEAKRIKDDSMDKLDAMMSIIEGHSEFFTNKVAEALIPFLKYRRKETPLSSLKRRFYDVNKKYEQYKKGFTFIQHLYERGGAELANLPLQKYPTGMKEIENPDLYLLRIGKFPSY